MLPAHQRFKVRLMAISKSASAVNVSITAAIVTMSPFPLPVPEPRKHNCGAGLTVTAGVVPQGKGTIVPSRTGTGYLLPACDVEHDISGNAPRMSIVRQVRFPPGGTGDNKNGVIFKVTEPWHDNSIHVGALRCFPKSFDIPGCPEV